MKNPVGDLVLRCEDNRSDLGHRSDTGVSTDERLCDGRNFNVAESFEDSDLVLSQRMLIHVAVHGRSKEQRTLEVPRARCTRQSVVAYPVCQLQIIKTSDQK